MNIRVELTDETELHCLKLILQARNCPAPLEIFLHTTQAIELMAKLSSAVCERLRLDSEKLLEIKRRSC
jgi:hypothetical protein